VDVHVFLPYLKGYSHHVLRTLKLIAAFAKPGDMETKAAVEAARPDVEPGEAQELVDAILKKL
jgi:hypothetical protein